MTSSQPAIALDGIVKRFPGVIANDHVTFSVPAGHVHALVGQNGAGKSTLMKILYGVQQADAGTIALDGVVTEFHSSRDAIDAGIGMVFQHFMLANNLTVWENIVLGVEPRRSGIRGAVGMIDAAHARQQVRELSLAYGLALDPDARVGDLSIGMRQRVEITKVLLRGARIIILDEPTAVLAPHEVDELFVTLRQLAASGHTIVFISHKLDEVVSVADSITVLRAGRAVASFDSVDGLVPSHLAEAMIGDRLAVSERPATPPGTTPALTVTGLSVDADDGRRLVDEVSFTVHHGEIVGVAGVEGNGQSELVEALIGVRPSTGSISLDSTECSSLNVAARRQAGMALIPGDRHLEGLLLPSPLWHNRLLGQQRRATFRRGPFVRREVAHEAATTVITRFDVKAPGADTEVQALSGGNQQKFIVGRELMSDPKLLLAAHPTRGVDVGAQAMLWDHLRAARADGRAVVLVSSDLDELLQLSDRLVVMLRGRIVADLDPTKVTAAQLGEHMTGSESSP